MSELDPSTASHDLSELDDSMPSAVSMTLGALPPTREGLPPGYRMRADSHYVEHLASSAATPPLRLVSIADLEAPHLDDATAIEPLVRSMRVHGLLHPLLVRADGGRYSIIAGRKRFKAAQTIGMQAIPCFVHHVDEDDVEALAHADNLRTNPKAAHDERPASRAADLLKHVTECVNVVRSARQLLTTETHSTAHRVALDLIDIHASRASWLTAAVKMLGASDHSSRCQRMLGRIIDQVVEGFETEARVTGVTLTAKVDPRAYTTPVDEDSLAIAMIGALVALVPLSQRGSLTIGANRSTGDSLVVQITQEPPAMETAVARKLFDANWTDRPGGWPALIGALTVKAAAERHGGSAVAEVTDRRAVVRLMLPAIP